MPEEILNNIMRTRKYLKNKLINSTDGFNGHEIQVNELTNIFNRSIQNGESTSALIIGPRGSGKTTLVREVLKNIQEESDFESNAILVKLNGLIHTDDNLALRSATLQMNLENAVDGKVFGTFAENLAFLLECLRSGQRETSKSLIFILEELDLFCDHNNQTLLYNLFDMTLSSEIPICVIGISCRLDVVELFEKRVKSRFSHRHIYLFNGTDENDSLDNYIKRIRQLLSFTSEMSIHDIGITAAYKTKWNKQIDTLIKSKNSTAAFERLNNITLDERILKNILIVAVSKLNISKTTLTAEDFIESIKQLERDDKTSIIHSLSVLELCLLIAMTHHTEIYDSEPFNFEMIFTRYSKFANANSLAHTIQRPVLLKAFEHIKSLELLCPVGSTVGHMQKEYQLYKLLVHHLQIVEAVKQYSGLPTEVQQWANSNLT